MKMAVGKSELANRGFGLVSGRFWHRAQSTEHRAQSTEQEVKYPSP